MEWKQKDTRRVPFRNLFSYCKSCQNSVRFEASKCTICGTKRMDKFEEECLALDKIIQKEKGEKII